jgi:hypothetical protein
MEDTEQPSYGESDLKSTLKPLSVGNMSALIPSGSKLAARSYSFAKNDRFTNMVIPFIGA